MTQMPLARTQDGRTTEQNHFRVPHANATWMQRISPTLYIGSAVLLGKTGQIILQS